MTDLALELARTPPLIFGLLSVAFAVGVLLLFERLRRAGDAASYVDLEGQGVVELPGDGEEGRVQVLDLRIPPPERALRRASSRILRLLERIQPGAGSRYRTPWFLCLGPTDGGKTTLLSYAGLRLPFGEPHHATGERPRSCTWWLFDRGMVLDVAGDLVLRGDGSSSDQPAWLGFLRLLRRRRRRRPVDGALLVVPVTSLYGFDPTDRGARAAVGHRADMLRRKLDQAQRKLGIRFPVYVLVTQSDRLPGFGDLAAAVEPGERAQMLGWSNPQPPDTPYSGSWVDDAIESITGALDSAELRILGEGRPLADPQGFVALPAAVAATREALRIYLNQVFAGDPAEVLPFRGLYFCGGEGFCPPGRAPEGDFRTESPVAADAGGRSRSVDFLTDLLAFKVFYEWSLARPAARAEKRRGRLLAATRTALVLLLLVGPALLWWGGHRAGQDAETLRTAFLTPAHSALAKILPKGGKGDPTVEQRNSAARPVLEAVTKVPDYRLRSFLFPASLRSPLGRKMVTAGTGTYGLAVFPAFSGEIQASLVRLAAPATVPTPTAPIYDLSSVPELAVLEAKVARLTTLEADVGLYNGFAQERCATPAPERVAELGQLARDLYRLILTPPTRQARRYYERVLCEVENLGDPESLEDPQALAKVPRLEVLDPSPYSPPLVDRTESLGGAMFVRLFQQNALVGDLDALERQIDTLSRRAPPASEAVAVYRELLSTFARTEQDLARPELAWAGQTELDLGTAYRRLTGAIARSRLLGLPVAQTLSATADEGFAAFRRRLAGYSTDATGKLLAEKDGEVQLALAPDVLGLRTAVEGLLARLPGAQPRTPPIVPTGGGTYLSWDTSQVTAAADAFTAYQSFVNRSFKGFPGFQQVVETATRREVELDILDEVGQAQSFPTTPDLSTPERLEAHLQTQVDNLVAATAPLNLLLQGFAPPPAVSGCASTPGSAYCQLAAVVSAQKGLLLEQLDTLYDDRAPYAPANGAFSDWDGETNLAWRAFGVANADALTGYLTGQRGLVQGLADAYATPILNGLPTPGQAMTGAAAKASNRWQLILNDLAAYKDKAPNGSLAGLEGFVTTNLATAVVGTCLEAPAPSGACFAPQTPVALTLAPPPCDPFLEARQVLEKGLQTACEGATITAGTAAYGKIAAAFGDSLAGHFPFASASSSETDEAGPGALASFYTVWDAEQGRVENLFTVWDRSLARTPPSPPLPWPQATGEAIRTFMRQTEATRTFFAPFLTERAAAKPEVRDQVVPRYDLRVDLEPQPTSQEQGGDRVIQRVLRLGTTEVVTGAAATPTPGWAYGTDTAVALRWANDGPTTPLWPEPKGDPHATLSDRTVTWSYTDPWSLLRLLAEHPASGAPAGTVEVEVVTDTEKAPQPPSPSPAKIRMRILLTAPGDAKTLLAVPDFPTAAPASSTAAKGSP